MPNWCYNEITIRGDLKEVSRKFQDLKNNKELLLMETLIGTPDKVEEDWYEYNIKRFGTNSDIPFSKVELLEMSDYQIHFKCESAWSPIIPFLKTLTEIYEIEVCIFFSEPGCDFSGLCTLSDGQSTDIEYHSFLEGLYLYKNEEFWLQIEFDIKNGSFDEDDEFIDPFMNDEDLERLKLIIAAEKYNL